jgi:hypothetical protein
MSTAQALAAVASLGDVSPKVAAAYALGFVAGSSGVAEVPLALVDMEESDLSTQSNPNEVSVPAILNPCF